METAVRETLVEQLEDRRARLQHAASTGISDDQIVSLLDEVDSALSRLDTDSYGTCLICEEPVEDRDLVSNPLLQYCLCGLTASQQRALEHDLGLARRLQAGLLPDPDLRVAGWDAHYRYEPAGMVSGDYCDLWVHPADPGTIFFAVADVSGKGVAASLLMAHIQAAFRSLLGAGVPLRDLVGQVNRQLLEANLPTHYATLACGRASADGTIELVNAGHCTPLIVRADGVDALGPTGLPVGMVDDRPYDVAELHLEAGDTLVLHTDGLTEARDAHDEEYTSERLAESLLRFPRGGARSIIDAIRNDVATFVGGPSLEDDLTILALGRTAAGSRRGSPKLIRC